MAKEDIKGMDASARLEKLKKLKKEREKEIAEAQELIKEAEQEITAQQEWVEKVPIPQIASETLTGLSEQEKQIIEVQKGTKERKEESSEDNVAKKVEEQGISELEQSIGQEQLDPEMMQAIAQLAPGSNLDYVNELSQKPANELANEMKDIYQTTQDKGYLSPEEHNRVMYLSSAMEQKVSDVQTGSYSLTQEAAQAASMSQQLAHKMSSLYKSQDEEPGNMYKSN